MTFRIHDLDFASLSPAERLALAESLLDSIADDARDGDLDPVQLAEIQRRDLEADADANACEPWETVRKRLLGR